MRWKPAFGSLSYPSQLSKKGSVLPLVGRMIADASAAFGST